MSQKNILRVWLTALVGAHVWTHDLVYRGLLVICGDSDYYLHLSKHLGGPSPDRPMGFPFFLAAVTGVSEWGHIPLVSLLAVVVHGTAILAAYAWVNTVSRDAQSDRAFFAALGVATLIQFFPLLLLMHSALLMPDSLALSALVLILCGISRSKPGIRSLGWAFLAGVFSLLRSGQLAHALLIAFFLCWRIWRFEMVGKKRAILICGVALSAALPIFLYHEYNFRQLGARNFGFIGGRTTLSHIAKGASCEELMVIAGTAQERELMKQQCRPEEMSKAEEYQLLWDSRSLFGRIDEALKETRAQSNERYERWAGRALYLFPGKALAAAYSNLKESMRRPVSYNFKLAAPVELTETCSLFTWHLWKMAPREFMLELGEYQWQNSGFFMVFDTFNDWAARAVTILALVFLTWPLFYGFTPMREEPVLALSYALAWTQLLITSFGVYYFTRHHLFFCALSFFQFSLLLNAIARLPKRP